MAARKPLTRTSGRLTELLAADNIDAGSKKITSVANGTAAQDAAAFGQLPTDATIVTTDVTTNNVSTSKHGWAPKAPNDATKFLRGDGTWAAPGAPAFVPSATYADSFSSTDQMTPEVGGNGTATFPGGTGLNLNVGAGGTGWVRLYRDLSYNGSVGFAIAGIASSCWFKGSPFPSTGDSYIGLGLCIPTLVGATPMTFRHIGFKVVNRELFATNADGTTEKATSLGSVGLNEHLACCFVVNAAGTSISYYWRTISGSWSAATTHTVNLPSNAFYHFSACISNTGVNGAGVVKLNGFTLTL